MKCPLAVGTIVIFTKNKGDRRCSKLHGVVDEVINYNTVVVSTSSGLFTVNVRKCIALIKHQFYRDI